MDMVTNSDNPHERRRNIGVARKNGEEQVGIKEE
jgi:hypothetical protein